MKKLILIAASVLIIVNGAGHVGAKTINTYNLKQSEILAGV